MVLPQRHRLRGKRVFASVYRQGARFHGQWLTLRVLPELTPLLTPRDRTHPTSPWRCAVVVSAKVSKSAVRRNQLKRFLHRVLTSHPPESTVPCWLVFSLKPGSQAAEGAPLLGECLKLLQKAGLRA